MLGEEIILPLFIPDLLTTQSGPRNLQALADMANYVAAGGHWTIDYLENFSRSHGLDRISPLIQISQFEDGKQYVHDGYHRVVATLMAERLWLHEKEFHITNWTYKQYASVNPESGWYTPINLYTHVRTPDFAEFKQMARQKHLEGVDLVAWITEHEIMFKVKREYWTIDEVAQRDKLALSVQI